MENDLPVESTVETFVPPPLKLRFPVIVVVLFWCVYFGAELVGIHMFPLFLTRLGATLLAGVLVTAWWLRTKRYRLRTRWAVLGFVLLCGVVAMLTLDHTTLPPIAIMWSLPLILTLGVLWLAIGKRMSPAVQVWVLCGVIVLGWLPGPLVRMEGLNGDGSNNVFWRWSVSAEEKFLQQLPESPQPSVAAAGFPSEPLLAEDSDWTQFRGPTGDSRVADLKIETDWQQHPPKLIWKHAIGPAWSSIIVVGDRLYTQEQRGPIEAITCYSAESGVQLWAHETKDRFEEPLGGVGPRATPAFADGKVYAMSARGRLDCLDARTGESIWSVDAVQDHQGRLPVWGYSVSPVVVDGKVIVFVGGESQQALAAYDAASGKSAWKMSAGTESYSSPVAVEIAGQQQVLYLGDSKLVSVDPASGSLLWEFASPDGKGRPTCQPQLVEGDRLLITFSPDSLIQIAVTKQEDKWSASEVWRSREIKPDFSDYVVHDGFIYGFDGNIFCCVDLQTGKRTWKKGRFGAGQALLLPEVPAVLVTTEKGELVLLACNSQQYEELARLPALEGKTWNHQTICRGKLFVRNGEQIACIALPLTDEVEVAVK